MTHSKKKSIIIFASGSGTNTEAIIQYFALTQNAQVNLIVCNKPNAGVLDIAQHHTIPFLLVNAKSIEEPLIINQIQQYKPDLIILAGFLWKIPPQLIHSFPRKIINVHPALLPKYGGKGMYGTKVHEAVFNAKESVSGITIHYVDEQYDKGAIIMQAHTAIEQDDAPSEIAKKIALLEHAYLPFTIDFLLKRQ